MKARPAPSEDDLAILKTAGVPTIGLSEACLNCDDPCEDQDSSIFDNIEVCKATTTSFTKTLMGLA